MSNARRPKEWTVEQGTGSIRKARTTGLRFVQWMHHDTREAARAHPPPEAMAVVYRQIENWLPVEDEKQENLAQNPLCSLAIGSEGVQLTHFADEICLQEDLEVSLVSLPVTVQEISFPMCLVAASIGHGRAVRPRTEGIPAWPLHQVPRALTLCSVEMPSGHVLYPFADSPHITQEGFIIHESNPEARAKVYRLLLHREIISNPREAAQEVLLHLSWSQEEGTPIRVFPFSSLQYLER